MEGAPHHQRLIRFAGYELDTRSGDLRKGGGGIRLHKQPLRLLLLLLEHPGQLVSREELRTTLWPDHTFVDFEDGLNHAIRRLRDALGDSAENPRFIETLPRLGYRFVGVLDAQGPIAASTPPVSAIREPTFQRPRWAFLLVGAFILVAVAVSIVWLMMHQRSGPPPQLTERRLTANSIENAVTQGAMSPDGKYLAYGDETGMHVRLVRTGEVVDVPQTEGPNAPYPGAWWPNAWFPDGSKFIAVRVAQGQPPSAWVISTLGGSPQKLRDDADAWAIAPDGTLIAFGTGVGFVGSREIWAMGERGEGARRLVVGSGDDAFLCAAWSPDGKRIAYTRFHRGPDGLQCSIESRDLQGGEPTLILSDPKVCDPDISYLWYPEGRFIYTMVEPGPRQNDNNLWEMRVDGRTGQALGKPRRLTNWAEVHAWHIGGTQDGKWLAVSKSIQQVGVYVGDLEANGSRLKGIRRLTLDEYNDLPGGWTPDSRTVLFTSDRNGTWDIFEQALDHSKAEPVVTGPDRKWLPQVSPDHSWILYLSCATAQVSATTPVRVMRVPTSGGAPQELFEGRGINQLICPQSPATNCFLSEETPDLRQLIISELDPVRGRGEELASFRLRREDSSATLAAATSRREELARTNLRRLNFGYDWDPSLDGRHLAFTEYDAHEGRIEIMPVGGGEAREVDVEGRNSFRTLNWSADGKGLFVGTEGSMLLYVDLEGRAQVLWQRRPSDCYYLGARPSPDGRHLRMTGLRVESNVWLLENF
jgi:Tol biopolymer transport system component/DNA-binding winged helix-turn-helix (wHTH) protein